MPTATPPVGRYPTTNPKRTRTLLLAGSVIVVVLGVVIAWIGYQKFAAQPVTGAAGGYEVVDASTIKVHVTVTRQNPHTPVSCIVYVKNREGAEIGRREFYVPPSDDAVETVTSEVRTTERPAMGDVFGCGTDIPAYLDR
ncbi:DUF4307 domain-containing protein [Tsukamurella sp. 8F]|uniref:DUF4307 domain-containing protein n=1 Tax=unclassified Tsukamurella TaxID=2633480 RepID=UPI0023B9B9EB|nr:MULTISPECIES: DUF4307 domain-containing protein [unclassified Tsukamurella]MDF0530168.1 DUF4307 domain-containing protein [Tsukamurella sp. 8J]MDF0586486.1 DUF4307 domain-containing protein [Tsukamurella sp. 8F]